MDNPLIVEKAGLGRASWRAAMRRFLSGPRLGWVCLAAVFVVIGIGGFVWGEFVWYFSLLAAAVVINACTWLTAIMFGHTRQLRSSWVSVVALLVLFGVALVVWPTWGRELGVVPAFSLIALGFPSDVIVFPLARGPLPHLPWGAERALGPILGLSLPVLGYLQAFVLLPLVFKKRRTTASTTSASRDAGRVDG